MISNPQKLDPHNLKPGCPLVPPTINMKTSRST